MSSYQCCMKSFPSQEASPKKTSPSSLFHLWALDTACRSHFVLFSLCTRRLLLFEMKDACLAAFKESRNSESHLYCRAALSLFLHPILRWWSKGWELREKLKDVCFGLNNNTNPQTYMNLFKDCASPKSRERFDYLFIWKMLVTDEPGGFQHILLEPTLSHQLEVFLHHRRCNIK